MFDKAFKLYLQGNRQMLINVQLVAKLAFRNAYWKACFL